MVKKKTKEEPKAFLHTPDNGFSHVETIEKLSPEMEAHIEVVKEEWLKNMTRPDASKPCIDKEAALEGIKFIYEANNYAFPGEENVFYFDSPRAACDWATKNGCETSTVDTVGIGYWAGWTAYYDYYRRIGLKAAAESEALDKWVKYLKSGVWDLICFDTAVAVIERPLFIRRDNDLVHCQDGPAIKYADGYMVCAWRGTRVPNEWILDKENIDASLALTHQNIEMRRILAEILGWERVLRGLDKKVIHTDPDPEIGELFELTLPEAESPSRFLKVRCGTGRDFVICVPVTMKTAREANAWTYGWEEKDFFPEVRT